MAAGTKLPDVVAPVGPAEQSDNDILEVVKRAKARRANTESIDLDTARSPGLVQHNGPNALPGHRDTN